MTRFDQKPWPRGVTKLRQRQSAFFGIGFLGSKSGMRSFGLVGLFSASALPVLTLCFSGVAVLDWDQQLVILSTSLLSLLAIFELWRPFPRTAITSLAALAFLAIVETWFIRGYGWTINSNTLGLIAETNGDEARGILTSLPNSATCCLLIVPICVWLAWPHKQGGRPLLGHRLLLYLAAWLLTTLAGIYLGSYSPILPSPDEPFPVNETGEALALRGAYPAGLPWVIYDYINERRALKKASLNNKKFHFGVPPVTPAVHRRIYVLVIGESSRADHWGINGYKRNTTPRLGHRTNLVSYKRVFSPWTYTRLSVPLLITRKPPAVSSVTKFSEPSILTAFKEAGFYTAWISLQAPTGFYDSPISLYAHEADDVEFLNPVDYRHKGKFDSAAVPALAKLVGKSRSKNLFIIVHLLGSHFRYTDRYPRSYARYLPDNPPDRPSALFNQADKEVLNNAYDNSILFTDSVVDNLISNLAGQAGTESWLMYSSDHGEALFDTCKMESGHGFNSPATQSVAFLFWASDAFRTNHPGMYQAMFDHRDTLNSTDMMFETLGDLAGLEIPGGRPDNSLAAYPLRLPSEVAHAEKKEVCQ